MVTGEIVLFRVHVRASVITNPTEIDLRIGSGRTRLPYFFQAVTHRRTGQTRKQTIELSFNSTVTLTRTRFQFEPVDHGNAAALAPNQSGSFQFAQLLGDAFTPDIEHLANRFVR